MPLDGAKLDELISSYLDNELAGEELRQVEGELEANPIARQKLESLQAVQGKLRGHFAQSRQSGPVPDLKARVLAQLPPLPTLTTTHSELGPDRPLGRTLTTKRRSSLGRWTAFAAAAAVLIALLWLPKDWLSSENPNSAEGMAENNSADTQNSGLLADGDLSPDLATSEDNEQNLDSEVTSGEITYVSQIDFKTKLIFVADVQITSQAARGKVVTNLLRQEGIAVVSPIVANDEIKQKIYDSRMIVGEENTDELDSYIFFVRAPLDSLGTVIDTLMNDKSRFTKGVSNLALNNPQAGLFQAISASTGNRFRISETFAAGLSTAPDASPVSFKSKGQVQYTSTGFGSPGAMTGLSPNSNIESLLIYVHVVD